MCVLIFFIVGPTKTMIQWVKYMPILKKNIYWIKIYVGPTPFKKKEVIVLGEKK